MDIKKVKPRVLLGFEVLSGVSLTEKALQMPGITLDLSHLPVAGDSEVSVRKARYFMTRAYAERIRDLLTKILEQEPGSKTVH